MRPRGSEPAAFRAGSPRACSPLCFSPWLRLRPRSARGRGALPPRRNPLRGIPILVRHSFRELVVSTATWLPRLASTLILGLLFWLIARLGAGITRSVTERMGMDATLRQLARALTFYGIWVGGLIAILSTLGLESGGIATAIGISGFVLGFAFKDILSHFFAGLMLLIGRQFRIGDQIVVGEFEGAVERIELRALHLRTYDNRLAIIPNGDVFTSAVVSNTASPHRRRDFLVGIGYDDDIEKACRVALRAVRAAEGVLAEPEPFVLVDSLAASTMNLRVFFHAPSQRGSFLAIGGDCTRRVKEAFDREGISMPAEIHTVILKGAGPAADGPGLAPRSAAGPRQAQEPDGTANGRKR